MFYDTKKRGILPVNILKRVKGGDKTFSSSQQLKSLFSCRFWVACSTGKCPMTNSHALGTIYNCMDSGVWALK
jgi:hypothetical protein